METADRDNARILAGELTAAVKAVLSAHGLTTTKTRMKYGDGGFNWAVEIGIPDKGGVGTERDRALWNASCRYIHLGSGYSFEGPFRPEHFGMTFMESGRGWTVTGMSPRSEKYPINVKRDDGKGFRMPAQKVALALKLDLSPYVQRVKVSDHLLGGKKA